MIRNASRKKVLVLCPFPPVPITNGGSERTSVLYSNLNACADVLMIWPEEGKWDGMAIVPGGALQISLAIERETQERISAYRSKWGSLGWGAALGLYIGESALFNEKVRLYAKDVDVIVLSHPWLVDAIPADFCGEVIYDAHNYEKELIRSLVADLPSNNSKDWLGVFHKDLVEDINAIEDRAIFRSNSIICVSDYDQSLFETDYPERTFKLIPSGFSPSTFKSLASRKPNQVLFFGSNHPPNIRAVEQIFFYATLLPEVEFIVAGGVCKHVQSGASNVSLVGQVSPYTTM
jgi:glycosyltransferase involved in cell wall biosynthesis